MTLHDGKPLSFYCIWCGEVVDMEGRAEFDGIEIDPRVFMLLCPLCVAVIERDGIERQEFIEEVERLAQDEIG